MFGLTWNKKHKKNRGNAKVPRIEDKLQQNRSILDWFGLSMGADIGIDLGTANVIVYVRGKGVVLDEPSVVSIDENTHQVIAVGVEAWRMLGRTPKHIRVIRPLREGVIADYDATEYMLKYFIKRVLGSTYFFKPRIMVCIPSGVTSVEKRAVLEAAVQAGARKTVLIEEPLAAALGAGVDMAEANGAMVVDIGGGTTDVAVLSLSGVVVSESLRVGGDKFDEAIIRYVRRKKKLLIGELTAEELKIAIGSVRELGKNVTADVRGRDVTTGLPKTITMGSREIAQAVANPVGLILDCIKSILEKTPPELTAAICDHGIILTGGGSLLDGMDEFITRETGIPAYLTDEPLYCVALGTGKALESINELQDSLEDL